MIHILFFCSVKDLLIKIISKTLFHKVMFHMALLCNHIHINHTSGEIYLSQILIIAVFQNIEKQSP